MSSRRESKLGGKVAQFGSLDVSLKQGTVAGHDYVRWGRQARDAV
jgi:hypothetical protein